jgi:hypothetical protein
MLNNYNNSYHTTIGMSPNEVNENTMHLAQMNLIKHLTAPTLPPLAVGDKVRVQLKPESFIKGYKPKYSKAIFEVTEKGRGYYKTNKDDRDYFRANLQKIEASEINPEKPDLEGTREGHLKTIRERPRREYLLPEPEARSKRVRRPISYDERYGDEAVVEI